ncbi:hypothetical protein ACFSRY_17140 [Pontibacter locisalis]|uniref:MORN repeat variant n=1 Tax=Pontibacter locisalis TaxID=1719035 RepID=A0ABW5IPL4_9BACT
MKRYLLFSFFLILPLFSIAQKKKGFLFFKINRFDKEGKYHGRWKVYFGKDDVLIRNGRFRHGREVGTWKYYYPDGTLYMKEKYSRKSEMIKVEKYHENGALARKGKAVMARTYTIDRYYWTGEWEVYDEKGNFSHTELYSGGNLVGKK